MKRRDFAIHSVAAASLASDCAIGANVASLGNVALMIFTHSDDIVSSTRIRFVNV